MTIQYLASEGIARLEAGKTFDLDRELSEYIDLSIKKQNQKRTVRFILFCAEMLALIVIMFVLAYAFLW